MGKAFQWFTKFTGWLPQAVVFRTKIHYEDKSVQTRRIKGPAIIISNHTSVYDFAVMLFVFPRRTLRYLMAEVLFEKKRLGAFLEHMGGIKVDRNSYNFAFIDECLDVLRDGGVVGIFPESRLADGDEERPLPFKPSAAYIALLSGVPVIPVYTDGNYFGRKRANVIIGKPVDVREWFTDESDEKKRLEKISENLRGTVIRLGKELELRDGKTKEAKQAKKGKKA